ncbi:hypothetical protein U1Q18_036844, partial [Sarracenia purpurea var. burkii]
VHKGKILPTDYKNKKFCRRMKHLNVEPKCIPGKNDGNANGERVGDNGVRK